MDKENKSKFKVVFSEEVTYEVTVKAKDKATATNMFNTAEFWEKMTDSKCNVISRDWIEIKKITHEGIDG